MSSFVAFLHRPWPWYVAGPLIGLTVPLLLIAGNKRLGISSTLRQICAACVPAGIPFLSYDWKKESWNLFFVAGILIGGFIAGHVFGNPEPVAVSAATRHVLQEMQVPAGQGLLPDTLFNWSALLTLRGLILMVAGGFLVGFGTRYAGGCTSGHGIMGLSALQWPSLVAVTAFFAGGVCCSQFILPYLLKL
ncbi:YeeE/YedE family protein [Compostibacter hankyongensis]|uniref:YeeE/YedE family protein n=1 Tax=Compostibacter hankyongensis TaxID=1007089 RepID=A0ABP8G791_9BACT